MKIKFLGTTARAEMAHPRLSIYSLTSPPEIDTGRNSQEDLLMTEISSHSKGNNYFAESIRTEEVDAVVHFLGKGGEEEKAAFQDAPSCMGKISLQGDQTAMRRIHATQITVCVAQSSCKPKAWGV